MILIFTDNTWTMMANGWVSGNDPAAVNQTQVVYEWADGNGGAQAYAISLPVAHAKFLDYLKANTDDNGICDIRSLQGGRP